ncbi:MAG: hypothetical protein ACRELT_16235, partial [Longimicrobiales bacterium]
SLLLVLLMPFLAGMEARTGAPVIRAYASVDLLSRPAFTAARDALPGISGPSAAAEIGSTASWRHHGRAPGARTDAAPQPLRPDDDRTHIGRLQRSYLHYRDAIVRARTNTPVSYGNPPPTSPT